MTVAVLHRIDAEQVPSKGDIALAGSLLGIAVLSGFFIDANRPDTVEPTAWWHWLLIVTPPFLVAFRRRAPIPVVVLASIAQAGIWVSDLPEVLLSIIVILYAAASEAGRRGVQVAIGASIGLTIVTGVGVRIADDVTLYQLPLIVLSCGTAIALGVTAAEQRKVAGELATSVAETRLRAEHERSQAAADERSHRIVQESLTNAIKYGGHDAVIDVRLTCRPGQLQIHVTNSLDRHSSTIEGDRGGAGLTGMAERAAVLGGTFDAGRTGNRFVVHATLPTDPHLEGEANP